MGVDKGAMERVAPNAYIVGVHNGKNWRLRKHDTLARRFCTKVSILPSGCWEWTGAKSPIRGTAGYGVMTVDRRHVGAHRVAYQMFVGPIPAGRDLDHLCRKTDCVNPAHLEPVTPKENKLRGFGFGGRNARKTHCPKGHEYTTANTIQQARGWRLCRECNLACKRADYARKKAAS
jgi:hypothetical protein